MSQVTPTSEQNSKNIFQTLLIFRISVKLFEYFFLSRFLHFVPTHECAHSLVCVFDPVVNSLLCKPELPRLKVAYKQAAVHVSCRDVTVIHRFSSYIMTT